MKIETLPVAADLDDLVRFAQFPSSLRESRHLPRPPDAQIPTGIAVGVEPLAARRTRRKRRNGTSRCGGGRSAILAYEETDVVVCYGTTGDANQQIDGDLIASVAGTNGVALLANHLYIGGFARQRGPVSDSRTQRVRDSHLHCVRRVDDRQPS